MSTVFGIFPGVERISSSGSTAQSPAPTLCHSLENPSWANFSFSLVLLLGILGSYLPQHYRIISRKSSEGISSFFLLLGVTSGTAAFLNILILSRDVLACCKYIGGFNCFAAGLGVAQVGTQWVCFAVILLLFMIYFPRQTVNPSVLYTSQSQRWKNLFSNTHPSPYAALIVTFACLLHFLILLILAFYLSAVHPGILEPYATFLGLQATILASTQYIPQIHTTWKLQRVGSLSIPMMCIQTPGSFVWAVSLATREGTAWSSWVTYVVTGLLQGLLLFMCIMFELRDRKAGQKQQQQPASTSSEGDPGEGTHLLQESEEDPGEETALLQASERM